MPDPKGARIAPALERGLTMLEIVATSDRHVGFNEFARTLSLSKASTARLLHVLRDRGYLVKDEETAKYRPGPKMAILGHRTAVIDRLRREAGPVLEALVEKAKNTALLIFWAGEQMQCIAKSTHEASIPMQQVGNIDTDFRAVPWGWIFYAEMGEAARQAVLATPTRAKAFANTFPGKVAQLRIDGYVYDDREIQNARRLAAPVFDDCGRVVGALGLGGNPLTMPDDRVDRLGKLLVRHAHWLSKTVGLVPTAESGEQRRAPGPPEQGGGEEDA